jgi:hypothetical protein
MGRSMRRMWYEGPPRESDEEERALIDAIACALAESRAKHATGQADITDWHGLSAPFGDLDDLDYAHARQIARHLTWRKKGATRDLD